MKIIASLLFIKGSFAGGKQHCIVFMVMVLFSILCPGTVLSQTAKDTGSQHEDSLFSMSLEELLNINIESAQKKETDWFTTPASMYVLTHEVLNGVIQ